MGEEDGVTDSPYNLTSAVNKYRVDLAKKDIPNVIYHFYRLHNLYFICFI